MIYFIKLSDNVDIPSPATIIFKMWNGSEELGVNRCVLGRPMGDIKITLETLYDILRTEKKREDLQKLSETFFNDVVEYLKEKQVLLESSKRDDDIFAAGEREKLDYELRSIKRILKQIYENREKKILDITLNKSRTGSDLIDTSAMLLEEKEFYQSVLQVFDTYRRGILHTLLKRELPDVKQQRIPRLADGLPRVYHETPNPLHQFEVKGEKKQEKAAGMAAIKFIHPVPSFVWKDLKEYGPFDIGEQTEIFPEVADLLVRKGRAVKVDA